MSPRDHPALERRELRPGVHSKDRAGQAVQGELLHFPGEIDLRARAPTLDHGVYLLHRHLAEMPYLAVPECRLDLQTHPPMPLAGARHQPVPEDARGPGADVAPVLGVERLRIEKDVLDVLRSLQQVRRRADPELDHISRRVDTGIEEVEPVPPEPHQVADQRLADGLARKIRGRHHLCHAGRDIKGRNTLVEPRAHR